MRSHLSERRSSHSRSVLVCGLDVHKVSTYATILDLDSEIVIQRLMPNEDVPDFLRPYDVGKVAMEAPTTIAPIYQKLARAVSCNSYTGTCDFYTGFYDPSSTRAKPD